MPYVIRKIRNKNLYSVKNSDTGRVHSSGSTLADAKAQVRLLESLEGKGSDRYGNLRVTGADAKCSISDGTIVVRNGAWTQAGRDAIAQGKNVSACDQYVTSGRGNQRLREEYGIRGRGNNRDIWTPSGRQEIMDQQQRQRERRQATRGGAMSGGAMDLYEKNQRETLRKMVANGYHYFPPTNYETFLRALRMGFSDANGNYLTAPPTEKQKREIDAKIKQYELRVGRGLQGEGLPTSTVKGLIDASYTNRTENKVGDLVLDRQLSTRKAQVYTNPNTGQVVVANRGTTGTAADWANNALYSVGLYGKTDRMKQAKKVQKAAIKKYGHVDVNVGHSQGGIITRRLNDAGLITGEIINVNPASMGERHKKNETVLRSGSDLVSAMHRGKKRTHVVKGISNPLEEHSTKFLGRMKKDFVGKGVIDNETTNVDLDEYMDAFDIKNYHGTYVKDTLPELNDGVYIINLNGSSHWTALLVDKKQYYYFDPFGFPAPTEVEDAIFKDAGHKVRYVYNTEQVQDIDHTSCGFYVVAWIRYMSKKAKDKSAQFEKFLEIFDDPPTNDKELKKLLKL